MYSSLTRWSAAILVVAIITLGGTAFGASTAPASTTAPGTRNIIIDNDAYYPARLRVMPGQTIAVTNEEGEPHSLTARDGSFDTGVYDSGTRYIQAPEAPGRYPYSCLVHGPQIMKGVLFVGG